MYLPRVVRVKALYIHDCDRCQYITSAAVFSRHIDLYRSCEDGAYIVRYSSNGADYQTVHAPREKFSHILYTEKKVLSATFALCQTLEGLAK